MSNGFIAKAIKKVSGAFKKDKNLEQANLDPFAVAVVDVPVEIVSDVEQGSLSTGTNSSTETIADFDFADLQKAAESRLAKTSVVETLEEVRQDLVSQISQKPEVLPDVAVVMDVPETEHSSVVWTVDPVESVADVNVSAADVSAEKVENVQESVAIVGPDDELVAEDDETSGQPSSDVAETEAVEGGQNDDGEPEAAQLPAVIAEDAPKQSQQVVLLRADGTPLPKHRFGEHLLEKGLITLTALDAASREQQVTGERLGQILVANGLLSDKDRVAAILEISSERIAQENVARSRIPIDILNEYSIVISAETEATLFVSTQSDEDIVEMIVAQYYPEKDIQFVSFLPTSVNKFIDQMKKSSAVGDVRETKETLLDRTLYRALGDGASDIHIIPRRKSYTVMFRLLGVRKIVYEGQLDEYKTMIAQIKDRSRMDLAERRKPQDGGFQIEYAGKMIDLRVATIPAAQGETIIMRVLDPDRVQPTLSQLGITDVHKWRKGFNLQHGLCLICGPTGSGKTTTLNGSIKEMNRYEKSIYTVEDPVEYQIPYVNQISVNNAVGLTFASAVRAFMRADPDVIVLGEVRDEETARNAIKAADTGHLVLATLHTGSILGAVSRLKDLGVPPRELRYLLRAVLVQTLVRTKCTHCDGEGCIRCKASGYSGRTVVSECEYFEDFDDVDRILGAGDTEVVRTWPTMMEDAVGKFRAGITDERELRRVFGAGVDPYLLEGS